MVLESSASSSSCHCGIETLKHTHRNESYSLLFLHFVGGSEVIKQLAVHLHEGLQDVVDERHDGPGERESSKQMYRTRR